MSEVSLSRIKKLLKLQTAGGGSALKKIFRSILVFLFVGAGVALFFVWLDMPREINGNLIWLTYLMTSYAIFPVFLNKDKSQAISYLLLPASTKEKIIALIIWAIGLPTMMLFFIIPTIILFQGLINLNAGQDFLSYMPVFEVLTLGHFLAGLLSQALFGFLALVYRKWGLVKVLLFFFSVFCIIVTSGVLMDTLKISKIVIYGVLLLLIILIWLANYYKLKKREI